jgi:hypothetical protein
MREDVGPRSAAPYRARPGAVPRKGMVDEAVKSYRVAYERDECTERGGRTSAMDVGAALVQLMRT